MWNELRGVLSALRSQKALWGLLIRNLEKSYNKRYAASLIENSLFVRDYGLAAFMRQQTGKYTCPTCGGIVSIHSRECSECRLKPDNRV